MNDDREGHSEDGWEPRVGPNWVHTDDQRTPPGPQSSSHWLTQAMARYRDRVLDGSRVWGSFDVGPDQRGFRRYRLILFPPGITKGGQRLLRFWRALPTAGTALWLVSMIFLMQVFPPWGALAIATTSYLAVALVTFDLLGATRTQVRTLTAVIIAGYSDQAAVQRYSQLQRLFTVLCAADALLQQGRISVAEHEAIWWAAYERIGIRCPNRADD